MDTKTVVEKMRNKYKCYIKLDVWRSKSAQLMQAECDEIADFIEQQEKYAELGRLAIAEIEKYDCKGIVTADCMPEDDFMLVCDNYWFCRLRAELLVEEQK